MNKIIPRLWALFIFLVIIAFATWGIMDWQHKQSQAQQKIQQVLTQAALNINSSTPEDMASIRAFSAQLTPIINLDRNWQMVSIQSATKGLLYYWGPTPSKGLPQQIHEPVQAPHWKYNSLQEVQLNQTLPLSNWKLQGVYRFYTTLDFYTLLKTGGYILLAFLLGTAFILIFMGIKAPDTEKLQTSPEGLKEEDQTPEDILPTIQLDISEDLPHLSPSDSPAPQEEFWFEDPQEEAPELACFLESALDHNKEDLCLMLIEGDTDYLKNNLETLNREIHNYFPNSSSLIPYEDHYFALVIPKKDLSTTLKQTKEFLNVFDRDYSQFYLHLGLTSKCGRNIGAEELIKEAKGALKRTKQVQERIIGFKVDPEKYKKYLQEGGAA